MIIMATVQHDISDYFVVVEQSDGPQLAPRTTNVID